MLMFPDGTFMATPRECESYYKNAEKGARLVLDVVRASKKEVGEKGVAYTLARTAVWLNEQGGTANNPAVRQQSMYDVMTYLALKMLEGEDSH